MYFCHILRVAVFSYSVGGQVFPKSHPESLSLFYLILGRGRESLVRKLASPYWGNPCPRNCSGSSACSDQIVLAKISHLWHGSGRKVLLKGAPGVRLGFPKLISRNSLCLKKRSRRSTEWKRSWTRQKRLIKVITPFANGLLRHPWSISRILTNPSSSRFWWKIGSMWTGVILLAVALNGLTSLRKAIGDKTITRWLPTPEN